MKWKSSRLESFQDFLIELETKPRTIFPRIVSAETILFHMAHVEIIFKLLLFDKIFD